ncbi:MAG: energy transducer TonB [Gemmatimonadetes bacterium]|nr:energy transducer TonB [Gemmatimonadota bacterium]
MLDVLVASNPRRQAGFAELATSTTLHTGLLFLVILTTHTAVQTVREIVADTTLVFLPRLAAPQVDRSPHPGGGGRGGGGSEGALIITTNPPARGFQVIDAIGAIPTDIPPVDPNMRAIDARDFTGRGVEGGVGWGVVGGKGPADQPPAEIAELLYSAETRDVRFVPAELVERPEFRFPPILLDAGVPGRAVIQFVIDTLSRVEPASLEVLEKTHEAFGTAAKEGVLQARFEPARYGGHPVRQLSKWPVRFALTSN